MRTIRWLVLVLPLVVLSSCASSTSADTDRLIGDLHAAHWQVRASAAEALGREGGQRAIAPLREALADGSPEVRSSAVRSLGRLGAQEALDDVRARLKDDKDREVVVQAAFALAALAQGDDRGRPQNINQLVDRVTDERRDVASAARRALFALVPREQLVAMIRQDLRERSPQLRHRAGLIANALALPELAGWHRELTGDQDADVRSAAFEAILRNPRPDDYAVLLAGLGDESPTVRLVAAMALGELKDPLSVPALVRAAGGDPDRDAREAAAAAIASTQGIRGSALPALWHYERLDDRLALSKNGECTLTRTFTLSVDTSPEPIDALRILLPASFPRVDRVADAQGNAIGFTVESEEWLRHLVFSVPPIGSGDTATFTVVARSRRPLSALGANELLLTYAPGPVQARVAALHVELGVQGADRPAAILDRTAVAPQDFDGLVVTAAVPASGMTLPHPAPRSYSQAVDWTAISGVVAALLGCLAAAIVFLRRRLGERADRAILVAVLTTGAVLFVTPILVEDNLAYYALARSAILDGQLDRIDAFTEFNQTQAYAPDNRGAQDPVFAALIRTPAVAAAHVLTKVSNGMTPANAPNGVSFPYLFLTAVGDFLLVLIGCLACFSLVERRVGERYALFAVLAAVAGTNLLLFAYAWTGSSFQPSFFLFSVFLNHWDKTREERSRADWLAAGVLLGLLGMTRTLNFGFAVIPFVEWVQLAVGRSAKSGRSRLTGLVGDGALLVFGMLLGFAPQILVNRLIDQTWMVDAYGLGTGRFSGLRDHLWGLFLSSEHGLFTAMPMLALAFFGLVPLFKIDRRLFTLVTAALAVQLFAIGSYELYSGLFVFGTPYLVPCTPIFCLALAGLFRAVQTRWRTAGTAVLFGVAVLFAARNGWCVLRNLAERTMSESQESMGIFRVAHTLLLLDRKLDFDILRQSSEFACLVRELAGAVRALDFGQLLATLFWVAVVVVPVLAAYPVAARIRRWVSGMPRQTRIKVAGCALAVVWLGVMGWCFAMARNTDLDYAYRRKEHLGEKRAFVLERIEPGRSFTWQFESSNPSDRFSVITFLDEAEDVPQGERVATVVLEADGKSSEVELRAGVDTADFAIDRPESSGARGHTAPLDRASFSWRVREDSGHFYTARAYRTVFASQAGATKASLTLTSALKRGTIAVLVATSRERKIPPSPARRRWLADRR
jgi:HEAT repeat protein